MIGPDIIKAALKLTAQAVGVLFVRADQEGDRPAPPFLSYKVLNQGGDPIYTEIRTMEGVEGDETKVRITSDVKVDAMVSLQFFGHNHASLWPLADGAWSYLESDEGKEAFLALGVFPRIASPRIEDRTVYLETQYEYRLGFDFRLKGRKIRTTITDAVDLAASVETFNN